MSTANSIQDYQNQLEASCPMADLKLWKLLKAFVFATFVMISQFITLTFNADPTIVFVLGVSAFLILWGAEVKEIEIANYFSMVFKNGED